MDSDSRKPRKKSKRVRRVLLSPLIGISKGTGAILKKALGENYGEVDEEDILSMVEAGNESGSIEDTSMEMINNVFEFDDLTASDVMTHRINIVGIDEKAALDDIVYLALEKGFSRIPVYHETIDRIVGILIVKDLLCLIGKTDLAGFSVSEFLRDAVFIPESCPCDDTFRYLTNQKSGIAVVIDEYGGTAGIVTLEDLIEAVMGNIQDEYDEEEDFPERIGKDKYVVDGASDPDEVLELFGYELPDAHEYDTIAGFVTDLLGYIPEPEDMEHPPHADYKDLCFIVQEVEDNCISKILVVRKEKEE